MMICDPRCEAPGSGWIRRCRAGRECIYHTKPEDPGTRMK